MTSIEIAVPKNASAKDKGDLLEKIAAEFLNTQNYHVASEVRVTGSELDLLCQHRVNRRTVYVECKAHRTNLSADVLTKLWGTVDSKDYQEGWLVSTGPLGKDAKGFQQDWESKNTAKSHRLSIYTPERVVDALINAGVIQRSPNPASLQIDIDKDMQGDWLLLVTPFGRHWVLTTLVSGVPEGVLVFYANSGKLVVDRLLLTHLSQTDTTLSNLDFAFVHKLLSKDYIPDIARSVVEVQQGETWSDYRPARPEDFVGRKDEQDQILKFLGAVKRESTNTRVFAITGDSGMGKSSLIAKLRSRTRNKKYNNQYFLYAVDVRAATEPSYIHSALLAGLNAAIKAGFGDQPSEPLRITNFVDPLSSPSFTRYLKSLADQKKVVCIVFDQFEELYSKVELFPIFDVTRRLLLTVTSLHSNLVLGFAWKTDSTVQQNHPAYYFWHNLSDHRLELRLRRFSHPEASSAITVFQKEIETDLRSDLRRQLIESSQGYPWLIKKLSIHVYEQLRDGMSQSEIMNKALDVESLFKRDLQQLSQSETVCLKMIAKSAPADWYEVLESTDQETMRSLVQKRLIVRSGERVNVYWDIFREYVLTGKVPTIPMTYLPTSPSLRTMLNIAQNLAHDNFESFESLGKTGGISEKSVGNIIRDLVMFGIATGGQTQARLADEVESSDPKVILRWLRGILRNHALTLNLFANYDSGAVLTVDNLMGELRAINPAAQHQSKTWKIYGERMAQWLSATGYLEPVSDGWKFEDRGDDSISPTNALIRRYYSRHPNRYRENTLFIGDTSPYQTIRALAWLQERDPQNWKDIEQSGHRNGARTLLNLRLIKNENGKYFLANKLQNHEDAHKSAIWSAAQKEPVLELVISILADSPTASGYDIGEIIASEYERDWTSASKERIGSSLRQWAMWLFEGQQRSVVPDPPGRRGATLPSDEGQMSLFDSAH